MSGKKYVPEGVFLVCDKGAKPSQLRSLTHIQVGLYGQNMCTQLDMIPFANFEPFGACACTSGMPCVPAPIIWTNTTTTISIGPSGLLLEHSELICALGGKIKIFYTMQAAMAAIPKQQEEERGFWSKAWGFTKGVGKGLWKGAKGMVVGIKDVAVWAGKHTAVYQLINPEGYQEQLRKDREGIKAIGGALKGAGEWYYRRSIFNTDANDRAQAWQETEQTVAELKEKASNMSAEEWGDVVGQVGFEFIPISKVGALGKLGRIADNVDDVADVARAADKLDDAADAAKVAENIDDVADTAKAAENAASVANAADNAPNKPVQLGDVIHKTDVFDYKAHKMLDGEKLGDFGERVVEDMLRAEGYDRFYRVQNKSGNGVDIVAKKPNGDMIIAEVKSTKQTKKWNNGDTKDLPLSKDQKAGGRKYSDDRLQRAANEEDGYTDGVSSVEAEKAQKAMRAAKKKGAEIEYKKYDVYVDGDGNLRGNPEVRDW